MSSDGLRSLGLALVLLGLVLVGASLVLASTAYATLTIVICGDTNNPCQSSDGPYQAGQYLPFAPLSSLQSVTVCDQNGKCSAVNSALGAPSSGYIPPQNTAPIVTEGGPPASYCDEACFRGANPNYETRPLAANSNYDGGYYFWTPLGSAAPVCAGSDAQGCAFSQGRARTYNNEETTTCPSGYSLSGGYCNLTSPSLVRSPVNSKCGVARSGNSYQADSLDSDCDSGSSVNAALGLDVTGSSVTAISQGDSVTQTINQDGTATLRSSRPNVSSGTTAVSTVNLSAPDGDGKTYVTGSGNSTTQGTGTANSGSTVGSGPTDYSRDATLRETNAKLDQLHDDLTGEDPAPGDPTARTGDEIAGLLSIPALDILKNGVVVPNAICPIFTIPFSLFGHSSTHTMDAQCELAETSRGPIGAIMIVAWSVLALFIVLSA